MKYKLQDLIDIEHLQNLQDRLNEIYYFLCDIIGNYGDFMTAKTWQDFCSKFYNIKDYEFNCIQRDQNIIRHMNISAVCYIRQDNGEDA